MVEHTHLKNNPSKFRDKEWKTVAFVFEMMQTFFHNYCKQCRNSAHHLHLNSELKRFRKKFKKSTMLEDICKLFDHIMLSQSSLLRLNDNTFNYYFFGDLHGSLSDMVLLWHLFWRQGANQITGNHFIFLGDYVDRGIHGFEVCVFLFLLKLTYPQNFTILRGNHEFADLNSYSFLQELQLKFGENNGFRLWIRFNDSFSLLPYAAVICNNIFCCHGGIPRKIRRLEEIEEIPKGLKTIEEGSMAFQLVWNDFRGDYEITEARETTYERKYFSHNRSRGAGFVVGSRATERFLIRFQLSYIVRAHDYTAAEENGFGHIELANGSVFTLFTNSSYGGSINNTAYLYVTSKQDNVQIFPLVQQNIIDDIFNRSELIETDPELREMKFKDPYSEIRSEIRLEEPEESYILSKSRSRKSKSKTK